MLSVFLPPSFPLLTFKVFAHTRRRLSAMEGKLNLYQCFDMSAFVFYHYSNTSTPLHLKKPQVSFPVHMWFWRQRYTYC